MLGRALLGRTATQAGFPGFIGVILVYAGIQLVLTSAQYTFPADVALEARAAILPLASGIALVLAAVAIARRLRVGYVLGLAAGVLLALAGVVGVVIEIPYLGRGGLSSSIAGGAIVIGTIWTLLWVAYGWSIQRARATFATAWQRGDRLVAAVLAVVVVVASLGYVGLGIAAGSATASSDDAQARAEALVHATTFEVRVVGVTMAQAPADGSAPPVEHLALEVTLRSPEAYSLAAAPTLCLADQAYRDDAGYKPGVLCWGGAGTPIVIDRGFPGLLLSAGNTTVGIELERDGSPCALVAGRWSAELAIAPSVDGGSGTPRQPISLYASVDIGTGAGAASTAAPCTGVSG